MSKFVIAAAFVAVLGVAFTESGNAGGAGQTALGKCVDSVVAACNKKKDASVNACVDSGISQCEKQHRAQIQPPVKPGVGGQPRPASFGTAPVQPGR